MRNFVCVVSLFVFGIFYVYSAPVPFPRAKRELTIRASLVRCDKMLWNGCPYSVYLSRDGYYRANPGPWEGSWSLEGNQMVIMERNLSWENPSYSTYLLTIKKDLVASIDKMDGRDCSAGLRVVFTSGKMK